MFKAIRHSTNSLTILTQKVIVLKITNENSNIP